MATKHPPIILGVTIHQNRNTNPIPMTDIAGPFHRQVHSIGSSFHLRTWQKINTGHNLSNPPTKYQENAIFFSKGISDLVLDPSHRSTTYEYHIYIYIYIYYKGVTLAGSTQRYKYLWGGGENSKDRKTLKSRSEEKVVGFSSGSLFPLKKRESVIQGGTRGIDHLT